MGTGPGTKRGSRVLRDREPEDGPGRSREEKGTLLAVRVGRVSGLGAVGGGAKGQDPQGYIVH